ncbi:hypothetical protein IHE44_0000338 [Lamprotornis superbus]|uniref:Uncharacterized protein n=1 Tax=Lamprotornis superbus TaxID=245042 RepID=A0A835TZN2_9PASS|nr:hypothetical protein IHE44_0000338 [Lamprotornis superbus]
MLFRVRSPNARVGSERWLKCALQWPHRDSGAGMGSGPPRGAQYSSGKEEFSTAMQQVLDNLTDLPTSTGAEEIDLIFLKGIMENPIAHERLEDSKLEAVSDNNLELVNEILEDISPLSLLEAHDIVASKCYDSPPSSPEVNNSSVNNQVVPVDAIRILGIHKRAGEPLASHVKEGGSAGLIPSQFLEEKRKAFVRRDWDNSVTSRKPRDDEKDGQAYRFVSRAEMEMDIKAGRYLEHGEYEGNLYGTKIDSILEVVQTGRTCILDVNPQALKILRTSEFMPYVVFIAAPELETLRAMHKAVDTDLKKTVDESARIQRAYNHYFDLTIVNDNLDKAFEKLQTAIERLRLEPHASQHTTDFFFCLDMFRYRTPLSYN